MTDERSSSGDRGARIDLRALDAGPDAARGEAVIGAVMARIAANLAGTTDDITRLLRARRRLVAVTVALAGLAAVVMLAFPRLPAGTRAGDPVSSWAQSSHVPTNAELLVVFQGYTP